MGEALQRWYKPPKQEQDRKELSREERRDLHRLRMGAKKAGALLASSGRGGLSPSLARSIFERDEYRCKTCGGNGQESGGLELHHKGHLENPTSRWLEKQGKANTPANLTTICGNCHDRVHEEDRARGERDGREEADQ